MPVELLSQAYLKIAGKAASEEVMDGIIELEVDESLLLPSMFCLRLFDPQVKWVDSDTFALGKKIEIEMKTADQSSATRLFIGEITAVEPEFTSEGPSVLIRGYDKSHRLHRGKKTRSFVQMKDSDLARRIAGEAGLSVTADTTAGVHELVIQDNQTDMEFLRDRAQRVGYHLYVSDEKLYFVKTPQSQANARLEWGVDLLDFKARLTTAEQVGSVKVRAWDPKKKNLIVAEISRPDDAPKIDGKHGGELTGGTFGKSEGVTIDQPVATPDEAKQMAQSMFNEISNAFVQAEGTCVGNTALRAGGMVELKGIGQRFSGKYRVSRTIHRYSNKNYDTWFEVSGYRANTIGQILESRERSAAGVTVGVVTNNADPENLGRVKVKLPTLVTKDGEVESDWARLVSPMAGGQRGMEFVPEVNDEVLVAFEADDIHRPFVLGALWNTQDKPPFKNSDIASNGKVMKRVIKTRAGHVFSLDDSDGAPKISLVDSSGKDTIEVDAKSNAILLSADKKIEIKTKGGHTIKIDDTGRKIEIVSGGNSIKVDGAANAINIESAAQLKIKGQIIEIEGSNVTIKGQAMMNIQSPMTTVKGDGMLTLQGGLVKIN